MDGVVTVEVQPDEQRRRLCSPIRQIQQQVEKRRSASPKVQPQLDPRRGAIKGGRIEQALLNVHRDRVGGCAAVDGVREEREQLRSALRVPQRRIADRVPGCENQRVRQCIDGDAPRRR
jgi:hypothetical protein